MRYWKLNSSIVLAESRLRSEHGHGHEHGARRYKRCYPRGRYCQSGIGVTRRYAGERTVVLCISYYNVEIRGPGSLRYIGFNKTSTPKGESMKFARVIAMLVGGLAIGAVSSAAMAGVSVGVNIGIPAPVYVAPQPVYAPPPPPVVYQPAPVYAVPPAIVIGWHGDRYWDGRRYWGRDDWYRHHGGYDRGRGHWDGDRGHWDGDRGGPPGHWH